MRIALCQFNPTIGKLQENRKRILDFSLQAQKKGAVVVFFPELALSGYPPRDLLERAAFLREHQAQLEKLAAELPKDLYVILGCFILPEQSASRRPYNSAAVLHAGVIENLVHKQLLPTYDVFDEHRYFEAASEQSCISILGKRFAITLCEDAWNDVRSESSGHYSSNPLATLVEQKPDVLINLSASPFTLKKPQERGAMFSTIAKKYALPLVMVNQVGGNDDLIFDGHSALYGPRGELCLTATGFKEELLVGDLDQLSEVTKPDCSEDGMVLDALILGITDYARKCGFKQAVLGLSGGVDSALCAALAAKALGPKNVLGVGMSTRFTSKQSVEDAMALASNLGIEWKHLNIDPVFECYRGMLKPVLEEDSQATGDTTFENLQSRIRGASLMAISNRYGHLLLSTGNKSELAVGYCTLYGDMAGGLAVISDLPKAMVYRICRKLNEREGRDVIPERVLLKEPSAELRPDQKDSDSLPPYEVLDPILEMFVENGLSADEIVAKGFDAVTVKRIVSMVRLNEYKRRQMPPGLIVTTKAFGPGRRYPIAQGYDA
ncbi:MAG: NAD+ synthase [Myxococcales bacterium]|nr:MAG: NAD+ synthase [Myxococcales bacterium]